MKTYFIILFSLGISAGTTSSIEEVEAAGTKEEIVQDRIYDPEELSKAPVPVLREPPKWPLNGQLDGTGKVIVEFVVTKNGEVDMIEIIDSSHELFSEATRNAVQHWKFAPGEINGTPVDSVCRQTIPFVIR